MYTTIWNLIQSGQYGLEDVTNKINTLWVEGQLTDEQRADLLSQAVEHLNPDTERPEILTMLQGLAERVAEVENRVAALEGNPVEPDEYQEWEPWDGMSDHYQLGAVVSYGGKLWISVYDGQNVWEPGVSDNLWQEYPSQEADT